MDLTVLFGFSLMSKPETIHLNEKRAPKELSHYTVDAGLIGMIWKPS